MSHNEKGPVASAAGLDSSKPLAEVWLKDYDEAHHWTPERPFPISRVDPIFLKVHALPEGVIYIGKDALGQPHVEERRG